MKLVSEVKILNFFRQARDHLIEYLHATDEQLLPALLQTRSVIVIATLFFTGARNQEVCNLRQADVVSSDRTVRFHIRSLKHGIVRDVLARSSFLSDYLQAYRELWHAPARAPLIFTENKTPPYPRLIHRIVQSAFPEHSPHSFRHTYASILADEAVDIRLIQYCLGHRHLNTTAIYLQKLAADKVGPIWEKFDGKLSQCSLF